MWCWPSIVHFTLPAGSLLEIYNGGIGGLRHGWAMLSLTEITKTDLETRRDRRTIEQGRFCEPKTFAKWCGRVGLRKPPERIAGRPAR